MEKEGISFTDKVYQIMVMQHHAMITERAIVGLPNIESYVETTAKGLLMKLAVFMAGNKIREEVVGTTVVPRTWWDAFKDKYYSEWAKRRWPVNYRKIDTTLNHYHVCPHWSLPPEKYMGLHVAFLEGQEYQDACPHSPNGLHRWMEAEPGKPNYCLFCGIQTDGKMI